MTPVERVKELLREEMRALSPASSGTGTPYSTVSSVEESFDQTDTYLIPTLKPCQAVELTQFPERAALAIDHEKELNQNEIKSKFFPLLSVRGPVTREVFQQCYNIYENNQCHFLEGYENSIYSEVQLNTYLSQLEEWFICIIEPNDEGEDMDWYQREIVSKYTCFCSSYCLADLRKFVSVRAEVFSYLRYLHQQLGYTV